MRNTILESSGLQEKITEIIGMSNHAVNEGKVFIIVEGPDDEKIFRNFLDEQKVVFYIASNCLHVVELLRYFKTNPVFKDKLIGIKDADFDHILHRNYPDLDNLFLTDYHDIEMTIVSKDFEDFLKAEYKIPKTTPLIEIVEEALRALSYLRLYNEVTVIEKEKEGVTLNGINFNNITYSELYDGKNSITWDHCLHHVKSKCNNAKLEHFPTIEIMEDFATKYAELELRQLTRGHDLIYALQVRLKHIGVNESLGYKGLCIILRSKCSKEMFEKTNLFYHLNLWMKQRGLHLWNKNAA